MKILVDGDSHDPQDSANSHRGLPEFVQKRHQDSDSVDTGGPHDSPLVPVDPEKSGDNPPEEVIEDIPQDPAGKNRPEKSNPAGKITMYVALAFVMVAIIIGIMMYVNLRENGRSEN